MTTTEVRPSSPTPPVRGGRRTGGGSGRSLGARARGLLTSPKYGPVLVTLVLLIVIFLIGGLRYPGFLSGQVFLNLFVDNAYLIVLAVGMTFVILSGGIDLSVGSVVALSTVIVATTLRDGWPMPLAVVTVPVVGPALGLLMGLVIEYFDVQ